MKNDRHITLSFSCDQDYDEMKPTDCGRFCDSCQKNIIDFRGKSADHIRNEQRKASGELCGVFDITQTDTDIICEIRWPRNWNRWAASLLFVSSLGISQADAQVQNRAKIVKVDRKKPYSNTKQKLDRCYTSSKSEMKKHARKVKRRSRRKKVYLTKRFPFVRIRTRRIMGRMVMGCPSF